jgi:hypothetical protein
MESSETSPGGINTRETPSAADAAVALLETLIDNCVDREALRKKFMERFGGDRHATRTYFSLALRRLVNAGKVVVTKSGGSEVICRSGELTEVIEKWGDLIDVLTWGSERKEIDPDVKTNGRVIVYLVRRGLLKALAAFICRGAKVWAYVDNPVDLSLVLDALRYVTSRNGPEECICPNGEITLLVPRRVILTYMAATVVAKDDMYVLKLPDGQTVSLRRIETDCGIYDEKSSLSPQVKLHPAFFDDAVLHLVIRFVRVVD